MSQQDLNECRLTGTVDRIRPVSTKTGAAMCEILLKVRQDKFRVTGLGNVADHLLSACGPGDRLSVTGSLSASNWKNETSGEWRNSFTVQCWAAEIHGDKISYKRKNAPAQNCTRQPNKRRNEIPTATPGDFF